MAPITQSFARLALIYLAFVGMDAVRAEEERAGPEQECLEAELIMFSGRPRPQFRICEEGPRMRALDALDRAGGELDSTSAFPGLVSTPTYQGIILRVPGGKDSRPRTLVIRKGFAEEMGAKKLKRDRDQGLERLLLELALDRLDESDSHGRGQSLRRFARAGLDSLDSIK